MIEISSLQKNFETTAAVSDLSLSISEGEIFGLIGTNGAGKSTLLRMLSGILKQDKGTILVDGEGVYENPKAKELVFFVPDDPYYFPNATPRELSSYYAGLYHLFDSDRYIELLNALSLPEKGKLRDFSKGMRKQVFLLLGLCANTKYLLLDETFDGLDPVMRQAAKGLLAKEMTDRGLTPVLSSHNLRELEDICDHVGFLHQGGIVLSKDLSDMKMNLQKLQIVFENDEAKEFLEERLPILIKNHVGRLCTYTIRGNKQDLLEVLEAPECTAVFSEILPLTLEEIFISEMEVVGYDIKKILYS